MLWIPAPQPGNQQAVTTDAHPSFALFSDISSSVKNLSFHEINFSGLRRNCSAFAIHIFFIGRSPTPHAMPY